jgi:hypothetical protein
MRPPDASAVVASTAAAAAADVVWRNEVWNKYAPAPGVRSSMGAFRRVVAELARLLPWRRRRLHGAMIAAINRNTETTRALIDATQHFQAHVIWYAQTVAAIASGGRSGAATPEGIEALQRSLWALSADWMKNWESLAAREQRYDARMEALTGAYTSVLEVASLAQQSAGSLKRAVEALAAARGPRPRRRRSGAGPDTDAFNAIFEIAIAVRAKSSAGWRNICRSSMGQATCWTSAVAAGAARPAARARCQRPGDRHQ